MKNWFVFIVCLWASQASAQGTYTATNCSQAAVAAAIKSEQANPKDGDIISIPAGSCTWNSGTTLTQTFANSVTIQGAGAISATAGGASTTGSDSTAITTNMGGNPLMEITTTAGKSFRFTGIAILEDGSSGPQGVGDLVIDGQSSAVRVDHVHVHLGASKGIAVQNSVTGVADHVYIDTAAGTITNDFDFLNGGNWNGDPDPNSLGNQSWVDTDHFGTSRFFYVEDTRLVNGWASDCSNGGRYVYRHITAINISGIANHGTHNQYRGCRVAEIYQSTFDNSGSTNGNNLQGQNSGPALIWGNTTMAIRWIVGTDVVRKDAATYGESSPPNGFGYCGSSSGLNPVPGYSSWDQNTNTVTGYPCLDQPGRGAGDLLSGNFPPNGAGICNNTLNVACNIFTGQWPRQALSPIYVWANAYSDAGYSPEGIIQDASGRVADNRDYYQQFGTYGESGSFNGTKGVGQGLLSALPSTCTAGPGGNTPGVGYWATDTNTLYVCNPTNTWKVYYAPYTYPHPLAAGGSTSVNPPTNLTATVQ